MASDASGQTRNIQHPTSVPPGTCHACSRKVPSERAMHAPGKYPRNVPCMLPESTLGTCQSQLHW
eukprot:4005401-Prymnesium_polylepis.1